MTLSEKIVARATGRDQVSAGETVEVDLDWLEIDDAAVGTAFEKLESFLETRAIGSPRRAVLVIDHDVPSHGVQTTRVHNLMRRLARKHGAVLHDGEGIAHQLLIERHVEPGELVAAPGTRACACGALGALGIGLSQDDLLAAMETGRARLAVPETLRIDLHGSLPEGVSAQDVALTIIGEIGIEGVATKAMELGGPGMVQLGMSERTTLCALAAETGASSAVIPPDPTTWAFLAQVRDDWSQSAGQSCPPLTADEGCTFWKKRELDLSRIEPAICGPHLADSLRTVASATGMPIDQGFIGSCAGGRIEDLRIASTVLKGRRIPPLVRLLVAPASRAVYLQALQEGLVECLLASGALILNPGCSACWGGSQGLLGPGEVMVSTGASCTRGRVGDPGSQILLASAATVVASCLEGRVTDPRGHLG